MNDSSKKYYAKNTETGEYADLTSTFDGLGILKMSGLGDKGKPVNIYTAQWVNSQEEDFMITKKDNNNNPVVVRENTDVEITFIVSKRYASNPSNVDVQTVHDAFVAYMTNSDVWVKSSYMGNLYAHCVCLKEYKPTTVKLGRWYDSYITGTITLHTLEAPSRS